MEKVFEKGVERVVDVTSSPYPSSLVVGPASSQHSDPANSQTSSLMLPPQSTPIAVVPSSSPGFEIMTVVNRKPKTPERTPLRESSISSAGEVDQLVSEIDADGTAAVEGATQPAEQSFASPPTAANRCFTFESHRRAPLLSTSSRLQRRSHRTATVLQYPQRT